MKELGLQDMVGKQTVIVEYAKIYPPEYYEKHRGRRKAVTSFRYDPDNIVSANLAIVDSIDTHRESIDMDSRKMITKMWYKINGTPGSFKLDPNTKFIEIEPDIYIPSNIIHLKEQIINLIDG